MRSRIFLLLFPIILLPHKVTNLYFGQRAVGEAIVAKARGGQKG